MEDEETVNEVAAILDAMACNENYSRTEYRATLRAVMSEVQSRLDALDDDDRSARWRWVMGKESQELKDAVDGAIESILDHAKRHHQERNRIIAKAIRDALSMPASQAQRMLLGLAEVLEGS